jgi:uncharacterized membrane protein YkoI
MTTNTRLTRLIATAAMAIGLGAGSYGIAAAASGTGSTSTTAATATQTATAAPPGASGPGGRGGWGGWGGQRSDETLLTGDTATKVEAAATARVPGATVVRSETDADGNALYEVHMTKADGTPTTVYVDKDFAVVSVETR